MVGKNNNNFVSRLFARLLACLLTSLPSRFTCMALVLAITYYHSPPINNIVWAPQTFTIRTRSKSCSLTWARERSNWAHLTWQLQMWQQSQHLSRPFESHLLPLHWWNSKRSWAIKCHSQVIYGLVWSLCQTSVFVCVCGSFNPKRLSRSSWIEVKPVANLTGLNDRQALV